MWYPARLVITVPSVYSVGGCHESVTVSPVACTPEPEEELEELLLDELDEPVLEQESVVLVVVFVVVLVDPCSIPGMTPAELIAAFVPSSAADVEFELFEDDPLPHAVNIPATTNEPAINSVHERTPVLFIGTPPKDNPVFECDSYAAQSYASNGLGALMRRGLPGEDGRGTALLFTRSLRRSRQPRCHGL